MEWMFGLECEFPLAEMAPLLRDCLPVADKFADDRNHWSERSRDQRIQWLYETQSIVASKEPWLELAAPDSAKNFPGFVIADDTGNAELVFPPVTTVTELVDQINQLKQRYGIGLLQATVSLPSDEFFARDWQAFFWLAKVCCRKRLFGKASF